MANRELWCYYIVRASARAKNLGMQISASGDARIGLGIRSIDLRSPSQVVGSGHGPRQQGDEHL